MPALSFPDERAFLCQISEVACRCRRRRTGNSAVLAGAHTALEPFRRFLEHSKKRFFLPIVELAPDAVEQFRLIDKEFNHGKRTPLRFDCRTGEPIRQILPAAHQHAMPFKQHAIPQWRRKGRVRLTIISETPRSAGVARRLSAAKPSCRWMDD
jgi:hypothetical protein